MKNKKINLAIIFGGQSDEHEVSLNSAKSVINYLDKEKYQIVPIAITKKGYWLIGKKGKKYLDLYNGIKREGGLSLKKSESLVGVKRVKNDLINFAEGKINVKKIDLVIPMIHGTFGEDGKLQGMLEMLGLPYLFSDTLASALAMNKPKTQILAKNIGLNVLPHLTIKKNNKYNLKKIIKRIGLPIVVKPTEAGSSVGVSIARSIQELKQGLEKTFKLSFEIMLEKYKRGRELTVGIIGNETPRALPIIEIFSQISDFYDYQAKYQDRGSKHICPAKIPEKIKNKVQSDALKIFQSIGCRDLARADFIWSEADNKVYFLEINTIPGMTSVSLVPEAAQINGLDFNKFLDSIIKIGLKRYHLL